MLGNIPFYQTSKNNLLYIGFTIREIHDSFNEHKRDMLKYPNFKMYQAMREYGIQSLYILLIEEINVETMQELRKREGQYIKLIPGGLNKKIIAGRDMKQYQIDNYEALKVYRRNDYRKYRENNCQPLKFYRQN